MLILRLLVVLTLLAVVLCGGMYLFTQNRRYLALAWRTLRFAGLLALVVVLLLLVERYVLAGWRILV